MISTILKWLEYFFNTLLLYSQKHWIQIFTLTFFLLPFLILSFYTHPQADDFNVANIGRVGGVWEVLQLWYYNIGEVTEDKNEWRSVSVAEYFGIYEIALKKIPPPKEYKNWADFKNK